MKAHPHEDESVTVVAFRAHPALIQALDEAAAKEGLSRADIARRATLRDLQRKDAP